MNWFKGNEKAILMTVLGGVATLVGGLLTSKGTGDLMGNEMQKSFVSGLMPSGGQCSCANEIAEEDIDGTLGIGE